MVQQFAGAHCGDPRIEPCQKAADACRNREKDLQTGGRSAPSIRAKKDTEARLQRDSSSNPAQLRGVQRHAGCSLGDTVERLLACRCRLAEVAKVWPRGRRTGLYDAARGERRVEAGPDGRPRRRPIGRGVR